VTLRLAAAGDPRSAAAAPPTKRRPGGFRRARVSRSLVFSPSSSITCPPSSRSPVSSCLRRSRRFRLMLTDPTTRRPTTNPSAAAMATSSDAGPVSLGGISNRGIRTAGAATPQCRAMPARAPGRAEQIRAADMAWIRPSSTREREPRGNGRRVRVGAGLGGDRRVANRYHEPTSRRKQAASAQINPLHARSVRWTLAKPGSVRVEPRDKNPVSRAARSSAEGRDVSRGAEMTRPGVESGG
jgi:hypothetical protein